MIQWMPEEKPYMTIHLPMDLESSIQAAVKSGRFASLDDAMAEAARLLLHTITQETSSTAAKSAAPHDPLLGIWRDAPEEIDEIVAEAMQRRREEPLRAIPGE
jgi:Arc/MetJ-type ribon-helix-helix transcriptional regulator